MSQKTRQEVLAQLRRQHARAGRTYEAQLLDQAVALFGYHRKAAVRALRARRPSPRAPFARGRPKDYAPAKLLPPLKAIWLAALQPCGGRIRRVALGESPPGVQWPAAIAKGPICNPLDS